MRCKQWNELYMKLSKQFSQLMQNNWCYCISAGSDGFFLLSCYIVRSALHNKSFSNCTTKLMRPFKFLFSKRLILIYDNHEMLFSKNDFVLVDFILLGLRHAIYSKILDLSKEMSSSNKYNYLHKACQTKLQS